MGLHLRAVRTFGTPVKVLLAVITFVCGVYLGLDAIGHARGHPDFKNAAVVYESLVALAIALRAIWYETFHDEIEKREQSNRQLLEAAWVSVANDTGVPWNEILVSLFLVAGFGKRQRLKRIMRVGVQQIADSHVRWTKGKGVVGDCWQRDAVAKRDLTQLNQSRGNCTEDQWRNKVQETTRMGLSFSDWDRTRKKYDMIVAVPLHGNDRFVGCVALTGPAHNRTWLADPRVEQALVAAARTIASTR